ncbi:glycosyltransferase family 2 protein [Lysobacter cavernae]|uniref:Glycosyltransferase family 2 protein n=1 Tax=Lysobacter cavernae TaxID=1685901 RepID=A0ABV7RPQ4_9GAMM
MNDGLRAPRTVPESGHAPARYKTAGDDARTPVVSAITPVYNGERYLEAALRSALAQSFSGLEIIVLNDGSSDRSGEIARDYAATYPQTVRYFEQANAGLCAARNAAMVEARGRYLALLDCDDLWMPQHLSQAVAALEADPGTVLVHADVRFVDEHDTVTALFLDRGRWSRWADDPFRAILLRHEHVACPTAVFRRDMAEALGGFDLRYSYLGCEDRDLWLRLCLRGRVRHLSYHGADYRVHGGGMSRNRERMLRARQLLVERMRDFPEGRRLHSAAQAALALSEAEECSPEREYQRMWQAYLQAVHLNPRDTRGWRGLLRASAAYRFGGGGS